ncbi:hypothetical protein [Terasakiella pusilla]|uniref:hypothetical protein n=1 Tax=Terasakiella pusilla TaxID=64973 RepID=UPI0004912934|nr:hypothetical protein [Terasakiella pusilla]
MKSNHIILYGILVFSALTDNAAAENLVNDATRAEVEIYGKPSFLMRVNPNQHYNIKVDNHAEHDCGIQIAELEQTLTKMLNERGKHVVGKNDAAPFALHFEYYGRQDAGKHCMLGYEFSIEQNKENTAKARALIDKQYDYDGSSQLMKILGMLHVDEQLAQESVIAEMKFAGKKLFETLDDIRAGIKKHLEND